MKQVLIYQASDGARFDSPDECRKYETLLADVQAAMSALAPKPDTCEFVNGGGFVQHDQASVFRARLALHELAKAGPLKEWIADQKIIHGKTDYQLAVECHPSWQMRMLDGACRPLERAYGRLACIDEQFREWGQQYFVAHPNDAKVFQLNT